VGRQPKTPIVASKVYGSSKVGPFGIFWCQLIDHEFLFQKLPVFTSLKSRADPDHYGGIFPNLPEYQWQFQTLNLNVKTFPWDNFTIEDY
jgi:hypothetical protein